jgi:hypothetical protein
MKQMKEDNESVFFVIKAKILKGKVIDMLNRNVIRNNIIPTEILLNNVITEYGSVFDFCFIDSVYMSVLMNSGTVFVLD